MEDIVVQLRQDKVINKYQEIYLSYNSIYIQFQNLEALKRMIFLQWYSVSEPLALSGLVGLSNEVQKNNIKVTENLIKDNFIDKEFKIMLLHYYAVSNWYFDSFAIKLSIDKLDLKDMSKVACVEDFDNRGQMGEYWKSLNKLVR